MSYTKTFDESSGFISQSFDHIKHFLSYVDAAVSIPPFILPVVNNSILPGCDIYCKSSLNFCRARLGNSEFCMERYIECELECGWHAWDL